MRPPTVLVWVLVLVVALTTPICWAKDKKKDPDEIGNRDVGKGVNFYSLEKEIALGKQMAQEVERQAKIIDDPVIAEYINRVGQNLVRNSDAKVPFTLKVLDSEEVNAFALPGGFFFVNTGLILKADNEAELAGVMAHEIAHVAARHGTHLGNCCFKGFLTGRKSLFAKSFHQEATFPVLVPALGRVDFSGGVCG